MYQPNRFKHNDLAAMHQLMHAHPLATMVTLANEGINANHIPLHLSPDAGEFGTLRGHVARANPIWQDFNADVETLVIFQGPDCYISPSFYPTKQEDHKVVPTWNYAVVHAYGKLQVFDDAAWVRANLEALTTQHEASNARPWTVSEAPPDYIDNLLNAIVGIELVIGKISGKFKMSQNQNARNLEGVLTGLQQRGDAASLEVAAVVQQINQPQPG
jgi:transcriptional regulator